jgi:hypothetical protein
MRMRPSCCCDSRLAHRVLLVAAASVCLQCGDWTPNHLRGSERKPVRRQSKAKQSRNSTHQSARAVVGNCTW